MSNAPVILVTGAARRVGAEIARCLHKAGARVMLHYRRSAGDVAWRAASLNRRRADSAAMVQAVLGDPAALRSAVEQPLATFQRLDGLVNNASSFFPTPVGGIDEADWDNLLGSN